MRSYGISDVGWEAIQHKLPCPGGIPGQRCRQPQPFVYHNAVMFAAKFGIVWPAGAVWQLEHCLRALQKMGKKPHKVIADKAYDADWLLHYPDRAKALKR